MFTIEDKEYPIGKVKQVKAPTFEDLRQALNQLAADGVDLNVEWNGWDDGSANSQHIFIDP